MDKFEAHEKIAKKKRKYKITYGREKITMEEYWLPKAMPTDTGKKPDPRFFAARDREIFLGGDGEAFEWPYCPRCHFPLERYHSDFYYDNRECDPNR